MRGTELRRLRKRLGLTQAQLAGRVGITANSIARQERGEMGIREPVARLIRLLIQTEEQARRDKPKGGR